LIGGQVTDDFGLKLFTFFQEKSDSLISIPYFTPYFLIAAHNL
jgi:hypothetical protein